MRARFLSPISRSSRGFSAGLAIAFSLAMLNMPATAREEIPAEQRFFGTLPFYGYTANIAACDAAEVLDKIRSRFASTERNFWNSNTEIQAISHVKQAGFRPNGLNLIPRRYCQATALMSNNKKLKLRYAIIEGAGITGVPDGIRYCLEGYDRNYTSTSDCIPLGR